MSFDGIMLRHVMNDLNTHIKDNRITKIYQLSQYDLLFQTRGYKNHTFLMSVSPQYTRLHRTNNKYDKPMQPPMFCMFLRKHLEGAQILNIEQHGNDRVATFTLRTRNEMGDISEKYLIYEALGKDSNIVVADENLKILDALKHTGPFDQTDRTITPTATYQYPTDERINPYDTEALAQLLSDDAQIESLNLLQLISGVSPLFLKEFYYRKDRTESSLLDLFNTMLHEKNYTIKEGKKSYFTSYKLTHIKGDETSFEDVSQLFDAYFYERDRLDKMKQSAKDLTQFIKRQIDRNKDKLEKLYKDLDKTKSLDKYKVYGELLLSYNYQIKKGDREATLLNYYTNDMITIPLDSTKTVVENSERYFKKYKKLKTSIPHIKKQILKTQDEISYFSLLESQLDYANLHDLDEMREELISLKYMNKKNRKKQNRKTKLLTYILDDDTEIMVGKNNQQNARITHKESKHFYVWFHVKDAPGSHVVVKKGFPLEEETIRIAAMLAAYYSKQKLSSSVPVDYTEIKHVKKIPGKHDSFVRYTDQKTIYIDPDEAFIKALLIKK